MRLITLTLALLATGVHVTEVTPQEPGRPLAGTTGGETWISRSEEGRTITLQSEGEVRVSGDGTRVVSIGSTGFLTLIEETGAGTRRMDIRPRADGTLEHTWSVDGVHRDVDADALAWLAGMLDEWERAEPARRRRFARIEEAAAAARGEIQDRLRELERMMARELEPALRRAERSRVEALRAVETLQGERMRQVETALQATEALRDERMRQVERALREAETARALRLEELRELLQELEQRLRDEHGRRVWIL